MFEIKKKRVTVYDILINQPFCDENVSQKIMCLEAGVELVTELGVEGSTVDDEGANTSHIANKPDSSMTHDTALDMVMGSSGGESNQLES
jgi:hypothetical protein